MTASERKEIKEILWELMQENKPFFKEILAEVIGEKVSETDTTDSSEELRTQKIESIIKKDFQRYKKVFKTLA